MEHAIEILIEDVRAGKVSHEEVVEWIRCAKDELRQMEDAERELNRQCEELGREAKVAEARLAGSEAELVNQILFSRDFPPVHDRHALGNNCLLPLKEPSGCLENSHCDCDPSGHRQGDSIPFSSSFHRHPSHRSHSREDDVLPKELARQPLARRERLKLVLGRRCLKDSSAVFTHTWRTVTRPSEPNQLISRKVQPGFTVCEKAY
uniref:Uncharacterized protein n=1 Tax=Rhodosorus marinus TaxID=101924 RepID=A0A7S3ECT9_9RHOD|mmetsp:Transcript_227/g.558  ORF Transcript_227/g.558 Transcript_227/m.558 type:complete len:206 (+) Transcript_227:1861-2478(+)